MNRTCGECTKCCTLLAVRELGKKAGEKCKHQSRAKGCGVYRTRAMPPSCGLWNCRWLYDEATAGLSRPDRSGYVLDVLPDYIEAIDNETGVRNNVPVIQVWCDPKRPDAHRDPALRAYLEKLSVDESIVALVRYNAEDAFVLVSPNQSGGQGWLEMKTQSMRDKKEHSLADVAKALGGTLQINLIETGPHA